MKLNVTLIDGLLPDKYGKYAKDIKKWETVNQLPN
jgi:hypothetical protein